MVSQSSCSATFHLTQVNTPRCFNVRSYEFVIACDDVNVFASEIYLLKVIHITLLGGFDSHRSEVW